MNLDDRILFSGGMENIFEVFKGGGVKEDWLVLDGSISPLPPGVVRVHAISGRVSQIFTAEIPSSPFNGRQITTIDCPVETWSLRGEMLLDEGCRTVNVLYHLGCQGPARTVACRADGIPSLPCTSDRYGFTAQLSQPAPAGCRFAWAAWR